MNVALVSMCHCFIKHAPRKKLTIYSTYYFSKAEFLVELWKQKMSI